MEITSFKVSQDKASLELELDSASTATTLYLWTYKTYRTEGLEIDLSTKLTGAATQSITITLADLELSQFDGVYFAEVGDGTQTVVAAADELTRYRECIIDKVLAIRDCDSCLEVHNPEVLNSQTLLYSLELSLVEKMYQEVINLAFVLDKFCSNDCKGCGKYKEI